MLERIGRLLVLSLAAAAAGCATAGGLKPWPAPEAGASPTARSGALFRLNVDVDLGGFSLDYLRFYFPTYEQVNGKAPVDQWQTFIVPGAGINRYPYTPIILPLPPGRYYAGQVQVELSGNEQHMVSTLLDGEFSRFDVQPGKLTALGQLNVSVTNRVVGQTNAGRQISTTISRKVDDSLETRLDVLDEALARPEAGPLQWSKALKAARAAAAADGDFSSPYYLKSWPSRADTAVAAAHPPTAALLKLKIDDTKNAFPILKVTLWFRRAEEKSAGDSASFQRVVIPGGLMNQFPNDLLLVPLAPGSYAGAMVAFTYAGDKQATANPNGDFKKFEIPPGEVTVLGELDLKFYAKAMTFPDGRTGTSATIDINGPALKKKKETLAAALKRPEAESMNWREALEAAQNAGK